MSDPTGRGSSAWVTAIRRRVFPAPTMKLLAMTMADYVNGDDECWPGNALLSVELGITDRQVQVLLAKLEALGVVTKGEARKEKGRRGRPRTAWIFRYAGLAGLPVATRTIPEGSSAKSPEIPEDAEPITGSPPVDLPEVYDTPSSFRNPPVEEPPKRTQSPSAPRRISPDFAIDAGMRAWARENVPLVHIDRETDSFIDYWTASGKTKADWTATWRVWMRKQQTDAEARPRANGREPYAQQRPDRKCASCGDRLSQTDKGDRCWLCVAEQRAAEARR